MTTPAPSPHNEIMENRAEKLEQLERLQDDGNLPPERRGELYRLKQQIHRPTPRQLVWGVKPGRAKKEEEQFTRVLGLMRDTVKALDKEGKR